MVGSPAGHAQTAGAAMLEVPARSVPVPTTVSPQMAKIDKDLGNRPPME
jgi:hypothetical protein